MKKLMTVVVSALSAAVAFSSFAEDDWTGEPDCYVEYVQATGQQYIDTGVKAAAPLEVETEMEWDSLNAVDLCFLGAMSGSERFFPIYGGNQRWSVGYGSYRQGDIAIGAGKKYTVHVKFQGGLQRVDVFGKRVFEEWNEEVKELNDTNDTLYLFAAKNRYSVERYVRAKCYSLKIWKGVELVRDFRPCIKNDVPCLYDLVSKEYFRNKAATPLVAGAKQVWTIDPIPTVIYDGTDHAYTPNVVVRTPTGELVESGNYDVTYEKNTTIGTATAVVTGKDEMAGSTIRRDFSIDYDWTGRPDYYLESIRSTSEGHQYINTWVSAVAPLEAEAEMTWTPVVGSDVCFLGANSDSVGQGNRAYLLYGGNNHWAMGYGAKFRDSSVSPVIDEKYHVKARISNGEQFVEDVDAANKIMNYTDAVSLSFGNNIFLFASNMGGSAGRYAQAKCYSLKIWQGGKLRRDFLPCVKNGEPCLYDAVSEDYFRNESATPFEVEYIWAGKPDYYVEYVQADGHQYIDTEIQAKAPIKVKTEMMWDNVDDANCCFLGACPGSNRFFLIYSGAKLWAMGYGSYLGGKTAVSTGVKYKVKAGLESGLQSVDVFGENVFLNKDSADRGYDTSIYLFASNNGNSYDRSAKAKCYSLAIWQNGEQVRKLYPCVKYGEPCLYDLVSKRYFRNKTSTPLMAGPKCSSPFAGLMLIVR